MASKNLQRILVYFQKNSFEEPFLADFSQCVYKYFQVGEDEEPIHVGVNLLDDKLILSSLECKHIMAETMLQHYKYCPIEYFAKTIPELKTFRGIHVGVVTLVESEDRHILLTRRSPHMRIFPGVWVPPGGHIEMGETLLQAGLRELKEETGLEIDEGRARNYKIVGLWESVFPPGVGLESANVRHHVVVYLHIKLHVKKDVLQKQMVLDPSEVDAATWPNENVIRHLLGTGTDILTPNKFSGIFMNVDDEVETKEVSSCQFVESSNMDNNSLPKIGRVSSGTKFALSMWLKMTEKSSESKL